jgi:hypothetical protein
VSWSHKRLLKIIISFVLLTAMTGQLVVACTPMVVNRDNCGFILQKTEELEVQHVEARLASKYFVNTKLRLT